ncbi:MAG: elongation factor G [Treponema sp.]|jgi:elongation factor G|nr:elongation factor G [Treponema sp.]
MSYDTQSVRNVSILGHGGTGKTTLVERLLLSGGVLTKAETIDSGKTVSDFTPEEIERKISIHASMAHIDKDDKKINLFDTPGSSDFVGDVILTYRAAEFAIMTVDVRSGVQIETIKLWRALETRNKPRAFYVTRMQDERADLDKTLEDIKEKFKIDPVPFFIPMGKGVEFKGVIDVLNEKAYFLQDDGLEKDGAIPAEFADAFNAAKERLVEAAAEGDDAIMETYLEDGTLSNQYTHYGLLKGLAENKYVPLFCGELLKNSGVTPLINFILEIAPAASTGKDILVDAEKNETPIPVDAEKPLAGLIIKTTYDQFSGKLNWVKVIQGKLTADSEVFNVKENKKEKIGKLYTCQGKKLEEIKELIAGDVGIIAKSPSLKTNNTITAGEAAYNFFRLRLPEPVHSVAVNATQKKDEDKMGEALVRATEEDKTFRYLFNVETKETVISGMGELHVNIILDKIKQSQKIEIETHIPKVDYRETITKKASAEYTHKKQSGGHGQYGKVLLEIAPLPRGEKYNFINAIFGGAIPKNYIPGVEKGVVEGMAHGTMASYPVVDVEVKVVDGKYHPVDSNELSFKIAARGAFREAMKLAGPTLLEPIMTMTVFVEEKYLGDVMSDLSVKRGKILGQDSAGGIAEIRAEVPQVELLRYSIDLRSITSGTGSFNVAFSHYAPISGRIADDVIKAAVAFTDADD